MWGGWFSRTRLNFSLRMMRIARPNAKAKNVSGNGIDAIAVEFVCIDSRATSPWLRNNDVVSVPV
jgi:hypothetical protein